MPESDLIPLPTELPKAPEPVVDAAVRDLEEGNRVNAARREAEAQALNEQSAQIKAAKSLTIFIP